MTRKVLIGIVIQLLSKETIDFVYVTAQVVFTLEPIKSEKLTPIKIPHLSL